LPALCCDAIIFNSRRVAHAYQSEYHWPARRCRVIPNGEWPRGEGGDRPRNGEIREIATLGRVTHAKGADTLLEAFAIIASRHRPVRLTYYGDGPLIAPLRERAAAL